MNLYVQNTTCFAEHTQQVLTMQDFYATEARISILRILYLALKVMQQYFGPRIYSFKVAKIDLLSASVGFIYFRKREIYDCINYKIEQQTKVEGLYFFKWKFYRKKSYTYLINDGDSKILNLMEMRIEKMEQTKDASTWQRI